MYIFLICCQSSLGSEIIVLTNTSDRFFLCIEHVYDGQTDQPWFTFIYVLNSLQNPIY